MSPEAASADTTKLYSLEEVKKHTTDKSCWLIIHGKVYDVTSFLEEHPGGYDIILTSTGKDATQDFEEIGHSNSAKDYLKKYLIGNYEGGDSAPPPVKTAGKVAANGSGAAAAKPVTSLSRAFSMLLPIILILVAIAFSSSFSSKK